MPPSVFSNSNIFNMSADNGDYMPARIEETKKTKNIDILILGSSHAYRGFDPRIFEEKGYSLLNLGSSSQTPLQTEVLLKRYYDILNPEIVIFEIYPEVFSLDGVEASVGLLTSDIIDIPAIEMVLRINNIKLLNSLVFLWVKRFFSNMADVDYTLDQENQRYVRGGYVERDVSFYEDQKFEKVQWDIRTEQMRAFGRCLEIIRSNKTKIILVYAPITTSFYGANASNQQFIDMISMYGETILNFNDLMSLDSQKYFYDKDHLNQLGVELFNEQLLSVDLFSEK